MPTKVFKITEVRRDYRAAHDHILELLGRDKDWYFWFRVELGLAYLNEIMEGTKYPEEVRQDVLGNSDFWNEFHNEWFRRECNLSKRLNLTKSILEMEDGQPRILQMVSYTEEEHDGKPHKLIFPVGFEFEEFLRDYHWLCISERLASDSPVINRLIKKYYA